MVWGSHVSPKGCALNPQVETLPSHHPLQYLHLTRLQVRPEKLLSVSAPTHHGMQLLLVKSQFTPSCSVRDSSASVMGHIVARHGRTGDEITLDEVDRIAI